MALPVPHPAARALPLVHAPPPPVIYAPPPPRLVSPELHPFTPPGAPFAPAPLLAPSVAVSVEVDRTGPYLLTFEFYFGAATLRADFAQPARHGPEHWERLAANEAHLSFCDADGEAAISSDGVTARFAVARHGSEMELALPAAVCRPAFEAIARRLRGPAAPAAAPAPPAAARRPWPQGAPAAGS